MISAPVWASFTGPAGPGSVPISDPVSGTSQVLLPQTYHQIMSLKFLLWTQRGWNRNGACLHLSKIS